MGTTLELQISLDSWNTLPLAYQHAISTAAYKANADMLARYDTLNALALQRLEASVTLLRRFSNEILDAAYAVAIDVLEDRTNSDTDFALVYQHWSDFGQEVQRWHSTNEFANMDFVRSL